MTGIESLLDRSAVYPRPGGAGGRRRNLISPPIPVIAPQGMAGAIYGSVASAVADGYSDSQSLFSPAAFTARIV